MTEIKNPSDIAREALRSLAARHLPPTPTNYQACYNEIAGLPNTAAFPESPLRQIAGALVPRGENQSARLADLDVAITRRSWQGVQEALLGFVGEANSGSTSDVLPASLVIQLAALFESLLPALGDDSHQVVQAGAGVVGYLRSKSPRAGELLAMLPDFARYVVFAAEEQVEIRHSLLNLLHLIIENIGELSLGDSWLKGQVDGLLAVVDQSLSLRQLDEMERRLRDVMEKQGRAKARSVEAQEEMRAMLAAFIAQMGQMTESSASFQGRIEESARQMEGLSRLEELAPLLRDVIEATKGMAEETATSRAQLVALQDKVKATESELTQLHLELDMASALARHDPLTDALNRKGLDEALAREIAGMRRKDVPLSLSLLDIDNFKSLNDRLGHEAGDSALIHLANVARQCMRPCDTLARYGGEEFVILMPDTTAAQGVEVMARLQRELTKAFFLNGGDKVLITFSAGVAQVGVDEAGGDAIRRADQAMYLAKRAGKNRVLGA
jgi:diguanylate cyclase